MIRSNLRAVAKEKKGIITGYQFQKFTGFTLSTAYSLWKDEWELAHLGNLNILCNLFDCTPNDLLLYEKDREE